MLLCHCAQCSPTEIKNPAVPVCPTAAGGEVTAADEVWRATAGLPTQLSSRPDQPGLPSSLPNYSWDIIDLQILKIGSEE